MKTVPAALNTHLQLETTTLAHCWKLTRKDGVVLGFTDHDTDLVIGGVTYEAETGFMGSTVPATAKPTVDTVEAEGFLDSAQITDDDIKDGRYDGAEIEIFIVNHQSIADGTLVLHKGLIGDIKHGDVGFKVELLGLSSRLNCVQGLLYQPTCRADLGDDLCKYEVLGDQIDDGDVTSVDATEPDRIFTDANINGGSGLTAGYFTFGYVAWITGNNAGLQMDIASHTGTVITLALPMPNDIVVGDDFRAVPGCDKRFDTCRDRFSNANNFRGEPYIPGPLRILETGGTE